MVNHTGGTWRVGNCFDSVVTDSEFVRDGDLATGHGSVEHYGGLLIAESIAPHNKPIIAAAPKLLAALEAAMPWLEVLLNEHHPVLMQAIEAILLVRGGVYQTSSNPGDTEKNVRELVGIYDESATDLLAALKEIVPAYDDARAQQQGHEILTRARAAIAKAEGR